MGPNGLPFEDAGAHGIPPLRFQLGAVKAEEEMNPAFGFGEMVG